MSQDGSTGPRCPICGRPTERRWRPFCSRRCADVDLGRWLSGSYAVPAQEAPDPDADGKD
jgi:endogenous inhibitor of DNA gyrase (YacG/DUF329 family)